jgi:hypothetical protein
MKTRKRNELVCLGHRYPVLTSTWSSRRDSAMRVTACRRAGHNGDQRGGTNLRLVHDAAKSEYEINKLFLEPDVIRHLTKVSWPTFWGIRSVDNGLAWLTILTVMSLLGYASLASLLAWHALGRFDVVAGRARRRNAKTRREVQGTQIPPMDH